MFEICDHIGIPRESQTDAVIMTKAGWDTTTSTTVANGIEVIAAAHNALS